MDLRTERFLGAYFNIAVPAGDISCDLKCFQEELPKRGSWLLAFRKSRLEDLQRQVSFIIDGNEVLQEHLVPSCPEEKKLLDDLDTKIEGISFRLSKAEEYFSN